MERRSGAEVLVPASCRGGSQRCGSAGGAFVLLPTGKEPVLSSNDENIQAIDTLLQKATSQPALILDREFDSFSIYRHLLELRQRFVIRATENRKSLPWGVPRSPEEATYRREETIEKDRYLRTESVIPFSSKTGA